MARRRRRIARREDDLLPHNCATTQMEFLGCLPMKARRLDLEAESSWRKLEGKFTRNTSHRPDIGRMQDDEGTADGMALRIPDHPGQPTTRHRHLGTGAESVAPDPPPRKGGHAGATHASPLRARYASSVALAMMLPTNP